MNFIERQNAYFRLYVRDSLNRKEKGLIVLMIENLWIKSTSFFQYNTTETSCWPEMSYFSSYSLCV